MTLPGPRDGLPATTAASIGERFERLPFTRYQTKLVLVLATCYLVDAADLNLLAYLLAPVSKDLGWSGGEAGLAAAAVFAGMAIGATVAGTIADKFGRRNVLVWSMVLWGTASLATAFAWNLQSFITFRVITGLGLGAEL